MTPTQIRSLRDRMGLTQEEFAVYLGLRTRGEVSRLESGARPPGGPLRELLRLLDRLEKSGGDYFEKVQKSC